MSGSNVALMRRFVALYNAADWEALESVVAAGYVHHSNDARLTWSQFKRGAAWIRAGMPDFELRVLDIFGQDDRVAMRMEGHGTHRASMFGEAPTEKPVVVHIAFICRIEGERLAEDWEVMDEADLRAKIGATGLT